MAILCVLQTGARGFVSGPSLPGGYHRIKPWYPDAQQTAQFAVNSLHPGCRLIFVREAHRQVNYSQILYILCSVTFLLENSIN